MNSVATLWTELASLMKGGELLLAERRLQQLPKLLQGADAATLRDALRQVSELQQLAQACREERRADLLKLRKSHGAISHYRHN